VPNTGGGYPRSVFVVGFTDRLVIVWFSQLYRKVGQLYGLGPKSHIFAKITHFRAFGPYCHFWAILAKTGPKGQ
jgi:hypothetical protein